MADKKEEKKISRREFLSKGGRVAAAAALGSVVGFNSLSSAGREKLWQIDPEKCIECGLCTTECVKSHTAVRCFHNYQMCGYCELCFGYFQPGIKKLTEGAENQLCPTGALKRTFIEEPYYEYTVKKELCIGCSKCVKGCSSFGNGSLFLQVDQELCLNCNECSISRNCPSNAFVRVSADKPYIMKGGH